MKPNGEPHLLWMHYGLSCFYEHNSSNKMMADRAICQGGIEMRRPGCSDGRWREREINRFSAAPSTPTYANLALKIPTTALVQLNQDYRETSVHGWWWCLWVCAFYIRIKALLLHKKLSCVVIIMIVTSWAMGIFSNDVYLHHHLQRCWCFTCIFEVDHSVP